MIECYYYYNYYYCKNLHRFLRPDRAPKTVFLLPNLFRNDIVIGVIDSIITRVVFIDFVR